MCVGDRICKGSRTTISCPTKLNLKRREWSENLGDGSYFHLENAARWNCKGGNGIPRSLSRSLDIDLLPTRTAQLGQQLLSRMSTRRSVPPLRGLSNLVMPGWENLDKRLSKLTMTKVLRFEIYHKYKLVSLDSEKIWIVKLFPSLIWEVFLQMLFYVSVTFTSRDSIVSTNYLLF